MALVKVINCGDELVFDLSKMAEAARKEITVSLSNKAGRMAVLVISADRSIPVMHVKEHRMYHGE